MAEPAENQFPLVIAIGLGTASVLVLAYVMLSRKQPEATKGAVETGIREKSKAKEQQRKASNKTNAGNENAGVTSKKRATVEKASGTNVLLPKNDRISSAEEKDEAVAVKKSSKRRSKKSKASVEPTTRAASVSTTTKQAKPSSELSESDSEEFTIVPANVVSKKGTSTTAAKSAISSTQSSSSFGPGRFDLLSENSDVVAEKPVGKTGEPQKRKGTTKTAAPAVSSEIAEKTNDDDSDSFVTVAGKSKKKKKKTSTPPVNTSTSEVPVDEDANHSLAAPMKQKVDDVAIPVAKVISEVARSDDSKVQVAEKAGKKKKLKKKTTKSNEEKTQESNVPQSAGHAAVAGLDAKEKEEEFETVTKKKKKSKKSNAEGPTETAETKKGHADEARVNVQQVGENDADEGETDAFEEMDKPKVEESNEAPAPRSRPTVPAESGGKDKKKKAVSPSSSSNVSQTPSSSDSSQKVASSGASSASSSTPAPAAVKAKVNTRPQASRASQIAFLVEAFPTISVEIISGVLAECNGSIENAMIALISRDSFVSSASLYTPPSNIFSSKKSHRSAPEEESRHPEQRRNVREEETDEDDEEEETLDPEGWKVEKKKGKKGKGIQKGKEVSSSEADDEEKNLAPTTNRLPPKSVKKGSNVTVTGGSSNSFLSLLEIDDNEEDSDEEESEEEQPKLKGKSSGGKKGKNGKKRS